MQTWKWIVKELRKPIKGDLENRVNQETLQTKLLHFGKLYTEVYEGFTVTPYMHIVINHSIELFQRFSIFELSISDMSQQGFEACHKYQKRIWERATSRGGGINSTSSIQQTMEYIYRLLIMTLHVKHNRNMRIVTLEYT